MVQGGLVPQTPDLLVHLCSPDQWDQARSDGDLRPESLAEVGFVHLSAQHQVHLPANRIFAGRGDLVLLVVFGAAVLVLFLLWRHRVAGNLKKKES